MRAPSGVGRDAPRHERAKQDADDAPLAVMSSASARNAPPHRGASRQRGGCRSLVRSTSPCQHDVHDPDAADDERPRLAAATTTLKVRWVRYRWFNNSRGTTMSTSAAPCGRPRVPHHTTQFLDSATSVACSQISSTAALRRSPRCGRSAWTRARARTDPDPARPAPRPTRSPRRVRR